jgi:hypothetical protein
MFSIKKNITGVKSGRICEEKGTRDTLPSRLTILVV